MVGTDNENHLRNNLTKTCSSFTKWPTAFVGVESEYKNH